MKAAVVFVLSIVAPVLISGCDSAKSAAARAGLAGFEARCEASLKPTRIDVVTAPVVHRTDRTRSWVELTAMSSDDTPEVRAVGLTMAIIAHQTTVETAGIEDASDGRVCVRPTIRVELSATPITVYISREIAGDPCRDAAALEHELKHVAVYSGELARIADEVRRQLAVKYDNRVLYYRSRSEAQNETKTALGTELGPMLAQEGRRIKERQRAIDTPEEYARVSAACGGMLR